MSAKTRGNFSISQHSITRWSLAVLSALIVCGGLALVLYRRAERKLPPTIAGWRAVVTTLAGDGVPGGRDGPSRQARFHDPFGIVIDREGNLYVADAGDSNSIRRITKEGVVVTLAGGREGFADGQGGAAAFNSPSALATDHDGNLFVADTGNNRIRKITPEGVVTTIAGDGNAGHRDGPANSAQFNGPVGIAVDKAGIVYVADTYNDSIRAINADGQVKTLAGGGTPGYRDGDVLTGALFDTPCAIAATPDGELFIADTGNHRIRKLASNGQVSTVELKTEDGAVSATLSSPIGLALTHDNFVYVTEARGGRVKQITPDGTMRHLSGIGSGFADGDGLRGARFNHPTGIAVGDDGLLFIADSANHLLRQVSPAESAVAATPLNGISVPRLSPELIGAPTEFPWPLDPQGQRHEMVATLGEVRGSYDGESRHHLHSGIDIQGPYGATARAVHEEKITSPICNWGFGELNEGLRVGLFSYIHLHVGRDAKDQPLDGSQFIHVRDDKGQIVRVRLKRGARFRVGDPLGTLNRMYHIHLNFGPPGAEINPLVLPFNGFSDTVAPKIERDGIHLFNPAGERFTKKKEGKLIVSGDVRIVVDAYDQVDGNSARRRLGLYKLGYQILRPDGTPAPGFTEPRVNIIFDRLPPDEQAVKIAYADESGITVYGSAATRFLYEVSNIVRDGESREDRWEASKLQPGEYVLRIFAADLAGNEVIADLPIIVE
ncbi:MAG: NHL repeat-containing protein [Pyrinomonadaceae bacterium]|nr:gluconolaconase [Pyrinomonadaceae bacterium]MDQ3586430.1 NHL repeat-containing protein [Acidobacteriota bacterium]